VWLAWGAFVSGIVVALTLQPVIGAVIGGLGLVALLVSSHGADRPSGGSGAVDAGGGGDGGGGAG
jgi:hypothetical protein